MTNQEPHPTIMWELTRACDLHCRNCTFHADGRRGANELTTYDAYKAVDQIAALEPRQFIITGGDPLERHDLGQIISYARRRHLDPALVVSPTMQLTADTIARLAGSGLTRMIFSIDGSMPEIHEAGHGVTGTFGTTLRAMRRAECSAMTIEVNTLVTRRNAGDLEAIADLLRPFHIVRWNLHFLVPIGGSTHVESITAEEVEHVFAVVDDIRAREDCAVRVVEAPHFRRFRLQRDLAARLQHTEAADSWPDFSGYQAAGADRDLADVATAGPRDFIYISHSGDVRASEFLPHSAGNLRYRPLGVIYRGSALFTALRNTTNLKGKCGRCEFRQCCGGSRARAWAMTGDVFATDPLCAYEPGTQPLGPAVSYRPEMTV